MPYWADSTCRTEDSAIKLINNTLAEFHLVCQRVYSFFKTKLLQIVHLCSLYLPRYLTCLSDLSQCASVSPARLCACCPRLLVSEVEHTCLLWQDSINRRNQILASKHTADEHALWKKGVMTNTDSMTWLSDYVELLYSWIKLVLWLMNFITLLLN